MSCTRSSTSAGGPAHGFVPGAGAEVVSKGPDGTITLEVGDDTLALGPALARQLFVAVA